MRFTALSFLSVLAVTYDCGRATAAVLGDGGMPDTDGGSWSADGPPSDGHDADAAPDAGVEPSRETIPATGHRAAPNLTPAAAAADRANDDGSPDDPGPGVTGGGDPFGDDHSGAKIEGVSFRLLLQTRYTRVFDSLPAVAGAPNAQNGFQLNRAFLRGSVHPLKWLTAKLLVDFAELAYSNPAQALKLAYGEIRPTKRIHFTVGLFKRTFSLLELLAIADYEFAEVGPTDNLIKNAQLAGRDIGAMLRMDPLPKRRWLQLYVGVFGGAGSGAEGLLATNGTAHTGPDLAAPNGLFTARASSHPIRHLTLSVDGVWRPIETGMTKLPAQSQAAAGKAVSVDATVTTEMLELRGEWLWGNRTDLAYRGDARTFMAAWGIVAVRLPVGAARVMPAARFEWLDTDREHAQAQRYFVSGALNLDISDAVRVLLDVTRAEFRPGGDPLTSSPGVFDRSATTIVAQLQLKV